MSRKKTAKIHTSRDVVGVTWVVVADASQASIYERHTRRGPLELVETFTETSARAAEHEILADAPGRTFDSFGAGRHAKQPEHTVKQNLREAFARHIAEFLEAGRKSNRYAQLAIIAAPTLLGELRRHLGNPTMQLLDTEIPKHMTTATPAEIAAELQAAG
jgi:protein required for attachment to host cells